MEDQAPTRPRTPRELIDSLCSHLPRDVPDPGPILRQAIDQDFATTPTQEWQGMAADLRAYGVLERALTPHQQLRAILASMATHVDPEWNGMQAIRDYLLGDPALSLDRRVAALCFPLVAAVYPQLLLPHIAATVPADRPLARLFFMQHAPAEGYPSNVMQAHLRSRPTTVTPRTLHVAFSPEELAALRTPDPLTDLLANMGHEVALELNHECLRMLLEVAPQVMGATSIKDRLKFADLAIFRATHGGATHAFFGPAAAGQFECATVEDVPRFPGLTQFWPVGDALRGMSCFSVALWGQAHPTTALLVRARPHELLAPLGYAPHLFTAGTTPLPDDVVQSRLVHRGALEVVEPCLAARVEL